jgi:hypothetical protein
MERKSSAQRAYEIFLAALACTAVALQIILVLRTRAANDESVIRGLIDSVSYFTVLTNLMVAKVSSAAALRAARASDDDVADGSSAVSAVRNEDDGARWPISFLTNPGTMTAVAVYIAVVGLTYLLLLRNVWNPAGLQLVADRALHDAVPVLYVLYWLIFVPKRNLRWSQPVWWLIYPVMYCLYSFVFGAITGKYMYWFVDPLTLGYPRVFVHIALLLLLFLLLGEAAVGIGRLRRE